MVILLFGPPGCGKGTQSVAIAERLSIPAISTGELFRSEIKAGSELGRKTQSVLAAGSLVDDELVNALVASRIGRADCAVGFLLDGYPRTVPQAIFLSEQLCRHGMPEPVVIHLAVRERTLVERITARRQCPDCSRIFNLLTQPPRREDLCDHDGGQLITRDDDREFVVRRRLRAYRQATGPVVNWYGSAVCKVDGEMPPEKVTLAVESAIFARSRNAAELAAY